MKPLAALALVSLAACTVAPPPADPVLMRGGKWRIATEIVDFRSPLVPEADRREILAAKRAGAAKAPDDTECRPQKTAQTWLKPGDPAPGGDLTCRYTRVERPGAPVDRTVECRGANRLVATSRTTGRLGPTDYELRIETSDTHASNVVIERGKWVDTCDSAG